MADKIDFRLNKVISSEIYALIEAIVKLNLGFSASSKSETFHGSRTYL